MWGKKDSKVNTQVHATQQNRKDMAAIRAQFEKELFAKLQIKATSHQSIENVLLKSFKYYDLKETNFVDREQFLRVVEKIGISIFNTQV